MPRCIAASSKLEILEDRLLSEILKPSINSIAKVEKYLSERIDPNNVFKYGNNAVHHAAKMGRKRVLERIIAAGGDPTKTNHIGQTALMIASRGSKRGHSSCVKFLLAVHSSNVNAVDHEGRTALRQAILGSNVKSVELLLRHGSDLSWDEQNIFCSNDTSEPAAPVLATLLSGLNYGSTTTKLPGIVRKYLNPYDKIIALLNTKLKEKEDLLSLSSNNISEMECIGGENINLVLRHPQN